MRNLLSIGFIWFGCAVAWMILGSTVMARTGETSTSLGGDVSLLWGPPMEQAPPRAFWVDREKHVVRVARDGAPGGFVDVEREEPVERVLPLDRSDLRVALDLEHRKKGLVWFATYGVDFQGTYAVANRSGAARHVEVRFPLAGASAIYDGFAVADEKGAPLAATVENNEARFAMDLADGEVRAFHVGYRSRGTSSWRYALTVGTGQVKNFALRMTTNFAEVDFPAGTLSPSRHAVASSGGWQGEWIFSTLVANQPIGVSLPERASPGPLAARITFFAPVGLLFFFFAVAIFTRVRGCEMHPLNYFFFGTAFFAFHLLFSYLVDHLPIAPSFALASVASIALVVSYAQLYVGWRFAMRVIGSAQLVYLVLFSFTFFWQGFTGLSITVGAVLTLAVMMQVTGRVDRKKRLAAEALQSR